MELEYSRDDLTRIRMALRSCAMACQASETGQIPGSRPYMEAASLISLMSGFVAFIEAGQEDSTYVIKLTKKRRAKPPALLPGLGGIETAKQAETNNVLPFAGGVGEQTGKALPAEKSDEKGEA